MANPTVTLRLPEPMYAAISAISAYTGRSAGDLGREAFSDWLENLRLDELRRDLEKEIAAKKETFEEMSQAVQASTSPDTVTNESVPESTEDAEDAGADAASTSEVNTPEDEGVTI